MTIFEIFPLGCLNQRQNSSLVCLSGKIYYSWEKKSVRGGWNTSRGKIGKENNREKKKVWRNGTYSLARLLDEETSRSCHSFVSLDSQAVFLFTFYFIFSLRCVASRVYMYHMVGTKWRVGWGPTSRSTSYIAYRWLRRMAYIYLTGLGRTSWLCNTRNEAASINGFHRFPICMKLVSHSWVFSLRSLLNCPSCRSCYMVDT